MAKIELSLIQELRTRTGVGMMDCKKALEEADGDLEKAVEILRKKGAAVAAKRAGNETSQGLVCSYIHSGSKVGVLVEVDCETDFVARTDAVKQFAQDIALHIAASKPLCVTAADLDPAYIEKERAFFTEQLRILNNAVCNNCFVMGDFNLVARMSNRPDYQCKEPLKL